MDDDVWLLAFSWEVLIMIHRVASRPTPQKQHHMHFCPMFWSFQQCLGNTFLMLADPFASADKSLHVLKCFHPKLQNHFCSVHCSGNDFICEQMRLSSESFRRWKVKTWDCKLVTFRRTLMTNCWLVTCGSVLILSANTLWRTGALGWCQLCTLFYSDPFEVTKL